MLESLKERVYKANLELFERNVVIYTWGNVSGIDRESNAVVIKPSGVDYKNMQPSDMVVVDLISGKVIEGNLKPSSDTPTHLALYRWCKDLGGITHTHSVNAVAFAQAGLPIKALGTTHADYFYGDVPCTRSLTGAEVDQDYELNTGNVIAETIINGKYNPLNIPAILVKYHGPFTWGRTPEEAVYNAVVLEHVAEMNLKTLMLNKSAEIPKCILDKHYKRKHGKNAYYGQDKKD